MNFAVEERGRWRIHGDALTGLELALATPAQVFPADRPSLGERA